MASVKRIMPVTDSWVSTVRRGRLRRAAHPRAISVAPMGISHHSSADTRASTFSPGRSGPSQGTPPPGDPATSAMTPILIPAYREGYALVPRSGTPAMSTPPPFGFGMPGDPGDMNPMDMSQLGAMLQQIGQMLQGGASQGPVNWDLARDTARKESASAGDPSVTEAQRRDVERAVDLAQVWLDPATAFPISTAGCSAWSRAEWIEETFPAWQRIVAPIAEQVNSVIAPAGEEAATGVPPALAEMMPEGLPPEAAALIGPMLGMARQLGASMFGLQVGRGIGALAAEVVGAADVGVPLTTSHRPVLLPANLDAFAEGLGVPLDEVRLYLALRECAHQRLFAHVPWLPARLEGAVDAYARGIRVDTGRLGETMRSLDPSALSDPSRLGEALGDDMFQMEDTPEQRLALQRLETLLALIEGWVCDVVGAAAGALPSADRLSEAVRRRRAAGGPAEKTFASLVGLELRPRAQREATALWATVRERLGVAGRDALWEHPDLLPDHEDLTDPVAFLDRSEGPPLMPGEADAGD